MDWTSEEVSQAVPDPHQIANARESLVARLPEGGLGLDYVKKHLLNDIVPGFTSSSRCATYYSYTTGAVTGAALFGEWIASTFDQNVAVHLPNESIATSLESVALRLLQQLLSFDEDTFTGRIFTTGATASNLLGIALGREFVVAEAGRQRSSPLPASIAELGLLEADSVISLPLSDQEPWRFDLDALASKLANGCASIVSISTGEVSSGKFATNGEEMRRIRALADQHGAWIHVDGAFGLQARVLPQSEEYQSLVEGVSLLELADSITGDCHKLLNCSYDCGFFFTRHLDVQQCVFRNPNAAYLTAAPSAIPSPMNIGLENSRRFRALPVYASLITYGRSWHRELLERQIALSRRIASYIVKSSVYQLLPNDRIEDVYMVVLFCAKDDQMNQKLVSLINSDTHIHVSGMPWKARPAARIAVGTWRVDVERDFEVVVERLEAISQGWDDRR
ncbi:pyridoxal phosphate-dependent transferase [Mycena amicta]|nr:pyridoxal phosphate-dependent transferase [Mycena amicta]